METTSVNHDDIDSIIELIEKNPASHPNGLSSELVRTLMENAAVFSHPRVIDKLEIYVEQINFACFSYVVGCCMLRFDNSGTLFLTPLSSVLLKGIVHLDNNDQMDLLKHICTNYSSTDFQPSTNFSDELIHIIQSEQKWEYISAVEKKAFMSKLLWLVMQQPRKMLNVLISQHVTGIYGLPRKKSRSNVSCSDTVLAVMHLHMHSSIINEEYCTWLNDPSRSSDFKKEKLLQKWIEKATNNLHLIQPKQFLEHVLAPLLQPSLNFGHLTFLVVLTKYFIDHCHLSMTPPYTEMWDKLLIQLAQMLDKTRWNIDNYCAQKLFLCENIIMTMKPLIRIGIDLGCQDKLVNIKKEISSLHLMTRAHFMPMWRYYSEQHITTEVMEELFIMTIHSTNYITYTKLNASSPQKIREEFIFSIATLMPKLTLKEMGCFIRNYFGSTNNETIIKATSFLWDCVMEACMRAIVYLKTTSKYTADCSWNNLTCMIDNFITITNALESRCFYKSDVDHELKFNTLRKIVMVTKQVVGDYQLSLLTIICRLIEPMIDQLNAENIAKLVNLVASLNNDLCKEKLEIVLELLTNKLKMYHSRNS